MNDLTHMTLADARDALKAKKITAVELTDAHVAAVSAAAPLNAYVLETPDHARAMAAQSDKKIAAGTAGPRRPPHQRQQPAPDPECPAQPHHRAMRLAQTRWC